MLVMLVMSLLLLLLLRQGTGWLLLAMADPPIGRTAENHMLASVEATKVLRHLKELSGCSISSSGMYSRMSSSKLPWSLWGCAIAESIPVEWILRQIMLLILSIFLAWTSGKEQWKSSLGWWNTSVHALVTAWWIILVSHLRCAPPPGPNLGGTLNWAVVKAGRQWWMAVVVRAMNVGLIESINDLSIFHSHLSYAIEVCQVNKIHNFSWCKLKLALPNWSSRQRLNK